MMFFKGIDLFDKTVIILYNCSIRSITQMNTIVYLHFVFNFNYIDTVR